MSPSNVVNPAAKKRPPNAGKGRTKGSQNKVTKALKDMILGALDRAGGEDYLLEQSRLNPGPFMTLIGKVLPQEINARVAQRILSPEEADAIVDEATRAKP